MLSARVYIKKDGVELNLLTLSLPGNLSDAQLDEVLGGKTESSKDEYLVCKNILLGILKANVSVHALRDWDRRRKDLRSRASDYINNNPEYATELLRDAETPQFDFEILAQTLAQLEFALSILNSKAYIVLRGDKSNKSMKKSIFGGASNTSVSSHSWGETSPQSVFSQPAAVPAPTSPGNMATLDECAPVQVGSVGGAQVEETLATAGTITANSAELVDLMEEEAPL